MKRRRPPPAAGAAPRDEGDAAALFRAAVKGARPIRAAPRAEPFRAPPPPVAAKRLEDERAVLAELSSAAHADLDDIEHEDDALYLRRGLPRDILRKLRRSHWAIQDDLDLHGLRAEEAEQATAQFLVHCRREGLRCVRIVHGKGLGSRGREPVLKRRIRRLLARRDDVLAYVEPRPVHGGGGAVVVLLGAAP